VRELLRAAAADGAPEPWAVRVVNEAAGRAPSSRRVVWLATAPPTVVAHHLGTAADVTIAELALSTMDVVADATRQVRSCAASGCILFFVPDRSTRTWCSDACGTRMRVARSRERRRSEPQG
jgi:predicted RNA-binding Zn ribbon-like protein